MTYTFRALESDELEKLPIAAVGTSPFPRGGFLPVVAIDDTDGEIVASVFLIMVAHVDGLWIRPDHRKSPVILKGLFGVMRVAMKALQIKQALSIMASEAPVTKRIAKWLGAKPFRGSLYLFETKPPKEP